MQKLTDGMKLYHGSYTEVVKPSLEKCAKYKDFGRGFYLTTSKEQAEAFVSVALKKAKANKWVEEEQEFGVVSVYEFHGQEALQFVYPDADANWLHCVVGHRKVGTFPEVVQQMTEYDIIGGKIADDATNFTILTYLNEAYGPIGSAEANGLCIGRLIPERLKDQYCFRTEKALAGLVYLGCEKIWNR